MRAPSTMSSVWLLLIGLNMVLLLHNVTAAAVRTSGASSTQATLSRKRPRPGTSTDTPATGGTANPLPSGAEHSSHSNNPNYKENRPTNQPECRNVSIGYHILLNPAHESANEPDASGAQSIYAPSTLTRASQEPCFTACEGKITKFASDLIQAMRERKRHPKCWASYKFSIVRRRARSVGCDTSLTLSCPLSSLCECTVNLLVPEQMNATKQEMENVRNGFSGFTVCNLRQFPTTISHDLDKTNIYPKPLFKNQKNMVDVEKRGWPLLGWRSIPGEAFVVQGPDRCPKPPAAKTNGEVLFPGQRAYRRKIIAEVCLCSRNRDNDEGQCSHTKLICETISLAQAIDNLRRGGADFFEVYVKQFPQLKNYVEPISGTAVATDQVPQQNWARILPVIASNLQNGLDIDLNVPAEANDEF